MEEVDIFIRDYFNGQLSEEEARQFQEKYDLDPAFRKEVDLVEAEIAGIRAHGREALKMKFSQWDEEKISVPFPYLKIGIAASVLLALVFVGKWALKPNHEDLFVAYYEPYENFEYTPTRDDSGELANHKEKAFTLYDAANYDEAAAYFSQYLKQSPDDLSALFFRAICLMDLGDFELAKTDFNQIEKQQIPYYSEAALWYLSLIDIRQGQIESAKNRLGKLKSSKDYQSKSTELLDKLD
ncbi:MAG: tetratricopeptide repeat protein [Reichenbachiella sp.]|uniref:tetratricopeptide repeat protein n=1 Tax=Reichenbachiella sp. TaxID=2184521 RepID=UPI003299F6E1